MIVLITRGLPGSGKTKFSKDLEHKLKNDAWVMNIELDSYRTIHGKIKSIENILSSKLGGYKFEPNVFIFDGLFLTNDSLINAIKEISQNIICEDIQYEIHHWNLDRESCLYNDQGRRKINSENTIKSAILEDVNLEKIKKETGFNEIEVITHTVKRKPEWQVGCDKAGVTFNGDMLYSEDWVISGKSWSYTGNEYEMEAESPKDFEEFDNVLMELCPNISFLNYKKIKKEVVFLEEYEENDYYSRATKARYKCNLNDLMKSLHKYNVL